MLYTTLTLDCVQHFFVYSSFQLPSCLVINSKECCHLDINLSHFHYDAFASMYLISSYLQAYSELRAAFLGAITPCCMCIVCVCCALFPTHGYEDIDIFMMSFPISFFHHMVVMHTPQPLSSSNGFVV